MDARYARGMNELANNIAAKPFDQRVVEYNAANPVRPRVAPPAMPSAPYGYSPYAGRGDSRQRYQCRGRTY